MIRRILTAPFRALGALFAAPAPTTPGSKPYDAGRAGGETSEWKLTLWTHAVAVLLWALALVWPDGWLTLPIEDIRELLLALGGALFAAGTVSYNASRSKVKAATLQRDATFAIGRVQAHVDAARDAQNKPRKVRP